MIPTQGKLEGMIQRLEAYASEVNFDYNVDVIEDAIEMLRSYAQPAIKVNSAGTVAVAQSVFWLPIDEHAPKGVRLLLINKAAGRATDGQLGSHEKFFDHYQAFPRFQS